MNQRLLKSILSDLVNFAAPEGKQSSIVAESYKALVDASSCGKSEIESNFGARYIQVGES